VACQWTNFQDGIAAQRLSPILFRLKGLDTPKVILKGRIMSKSRVLVSSAVLALSAVLSSAAPAQTAAPKVAKVELNDGSKAYPAPPDNQRPDYPTLPTAAGTTQAELP
jgi:hypothetical protein